MEVCLKETVVLHRSKANSLCEVKRLQCWGMSLSDISVLEKASSLEVLNLSCNKLKNLYPLKYCVNLQQIYLRKNQINDISELSHLKDLSNLKTLWLSGNPISSLSNYRSVVIGILPQLQQLDETVISDKERQQALSEKNKHSEEQSHLCTAVLALLPLLDHTSLVKVNGALQQILLKE